MKKFTPYLIILSFILSSISFITIRKGYGEIYPFYTWMLFTKPHGMKKAEQFYKIYGIMGKDTTRILNTKSELFDGNEKFGIIKRYGELIKNNIDIQTNKKHLYDFVQITAPGYEKYLLVLEILNLNELDSINLISHKEIITEIKKQ